MNSNRFRTVLALVPLATLAVLTTGTLAAGYGKSRPHALHAEAHGDKVRASLGSHCVRRGRTALCADAAYPLPVRGELAVGSGDRVVLRLHDRRVKRVRVGLLRVADGSSRFEPTGWSARARPVRGHPRRVSFRLPADLEGANRLDVFVRYEDGIGDAGYWAGLKSGR